MVEEGLGRAPACLIVPGLGNSTEGHWQTNWEADRADCERVELGLWEAPDRNVWVGKLDRAIVDADAPVILVAHSLGCTTVAWWASLVGAEGTGKVRGALLVAPPDVERNGVDPRVASFAPAPREVLPFPTIVVASSDEPYAPLAKAGEIAAAWGAAFVDAGAKGHMNAASHMGLWPDGQALLEQLIDGAESPKATVLAAR